ncbi:MAG: hypothetical protein ACYDAI_09470 [Trichloromonadaceae bacterium]
MQDIINGQPVTTLQLRKEDQLKDVIETYNQLLQRLNSAAAKPQD